MSKLNEWGPMTVLTILVALVVVGVGGAVVILQPETLSFNAYLEYLQKFAYAIAGVAAGRGLLAAGKHVADGQVQSAAIASTAEPTLPLSPALTAQPITGAVGGFEEPDEEDLAAAWDDDIIAEIDEEPDAELGVPKATGERAEA